eukprot:98948_1
MASLILLLILSNSLLYNCIASVIWYSCPEYIMRPSMVKYASNIACTNISIPYSYNNSKLGNFTYQLYSYTPTSSYPLSGYIWFLSGGPGNTGTDMLSLLLNNTNSINFLNANNFVTIFPDHRGTGYSHPLNCPKNTTLNNISCLQSLQKQLGYDIYNSFTIDNAAHDVHTAINIVHNTTNISSNIFIIGASYGSLWLDRLLLLYPNINLKGVIYDGVLNSETDMIYWNRNSGDISMSYFSLCLLSNICNQYFNQFGTGVAEQFRYFYESYNDGTNECVNKIPLFNDTSNGITSYIIKSFFWNTINYDVFFHDFKTFPYAVIYRFLRCNSYDQQILQNWFMVTASMLAEFGAIFMNDSAPLHDLINYSELLIKPLPNGTIYIPSPQEEINWSNDALLSNDNAAPTVNTTNSYKINQYMNAGLLYPINQDTWHKISNSNHERLLLHGNMDFNAPYFQDTKFNQNYYNKTNWNLVSFPLIGHTPIFWGDECVW